MDWNADGILDFISGSYDPGDLDLFRGLGKGEYAKVEQLVDETGTPLVHHPEQLKQYELLRDDPDALEEQTIQACIASFGSWPFPIDWDADGGPLIVTLAAAPAHDNDADSRSLFARPVLLTAGSGPFEGTSRSSAAAARCSSARTERPTSPSCAEQRGRAATRRGGEFGRRVEENASKGTDQGAAERGRRAGLCYTPGLTPSTPFLCLSCPPPPSSSTTS